MSERTRHHLGLAMTLRGEETPWSALSEEEWNELAGTARHEGVAPVLYHVQASAGWPCGMPPRLRDELRVECLKAGGSNLLVYRELGRILSALRGEVVLLKGAALASTIYPTIALRPMTDIDILLRRGCVESAVERLRSIGYGDVAPEMTLGLSRETHFQVALKGGPRGYVITELHWSLVGSAGDWRSPDLDWFWKETEPWRMEEERDARGAPLSALQLRPHAHLLYLAAHLMLQHGGANGRLLWAYDIHLLVTQYAKRIDWEELRRRARDFHWAPALHAALVRTHRTFGTVLPDDYLQAIESDGDRRSKALVESKSKPVQTPATATWNYLRSLDRRSRRRRIRAILWPTREYMLWRYRPHPRWLWPCCYPYRWTLFMLEITRTLARVIGKTIASGSARIPNGARG